jgi:hypothetical protein
MRKFIIKLLFSYREIQILESLLADQLHSTKEKIYSRKYDTHINYYVQYLNELTELYNKLF